ncbi:hypothetical protein [Pleomorphomonas carboxyditropha]|uniref:Uncharacterized protein n=1 Tax=Pleomorphomonas carboxyditropha TaxID=2023338 RepID=A0A2G9X2V1_9HYPH|nr:hypothetical protein [Pleomorphomonas carboxyditropha]PIP00691.1 hypothetical protein CJ014_00880 [Pleomorphomonas carboxyditropha]
MTRGIEITAEQRIDVIILYMYRCAIQPRIAEYVGLGLSTVERLVSDIKRGGTQYLKDVGYLDADGRPSKLARERSEVMDQRAAAEKEKLAALEARGRAFDERKRREAAAAKASVPETISEEPKRVVVTPATVEKTAEEKAKKPILVRVFGGEKVDVESVSDMSAVRILNKTSRAGKRGITRFAITSAQDDTEIFKPLWNNMQAFCDQFDINIRVCGTTYQKGLYEDHNVRTATYDPEIQPFMQYDRESLVDDVLLISDANVLPTTANPLSGWQTANRGRNVIIPSARVHIQSIPRMFGAEPNFAMTTGTITQPNYTARAAGQKSVFHHTPGFLLVEVDHDGAVFMRPVVAADDGSFQDLDIIVRDGRILDFQRMLSIVWGDIHREKLDPLMALWCWGFDVFRDVVTRRTRTVIDCLRPSHQFFHDLNDFEVRNHHTRNNPHERARFVADGNDDVEYWLKRAAKFVDAAGRDYCQSHMVISNHDDALTRWLLDPSGAADAQNAWLWHELNARAHKAIREQRPHSVVEDTMRRYGMRDVQFHDYGDSFELAGIEHAAHGDCGTNGARGSMAGFRRVAPKITFGHGHTGGALDGAWEAGVSGSYDMRYNAKGLTTWTHSEVALAENGKRTLINHVADGRWRAVGRA